MMAIAEQVDNLKSMSRQLYEKDTVRDREYRRLKAFNKIIVKSNESKNQKELLQGILDACLEFVNFDLGGIYLVKDHKAQVIVTKFIPQSATTMLNNMCIERPELKELFTFGKPLYIKHYDVEHPENSKILGGVKTLISVPILYNDKVRGCVNVGAFNDVSITDEDCDILRTLGKHLGHVLHRFEIEQELQVNVFEIEAYTQELHATICQYQEMNTKLEESQQQLDLERANFKTLFNKITDMIFVISLEGTIIAINDAVRTRLGYPNGQLIGKPITIVHKSDQCEEVIKIVKQMMSGELSHCALTLISKDAEVVSVDTRVSKGLWNGQEVIFGSSRELTTSCN
jgi:PAS domain S-box-containing protein